MIRSEASHNNFQFFVDTHNLTHKMPEVLPPGDVLLHAGDFSNTGLPREVDKFITFLSEQPYPIKVPYLTNLPLLVIISYMCYTWPMVINS